MAVDTDLVLTVTEPALEKILEIRDGEDDPTSLALRVEVVGQDGREYAYDLGFEPLDDAGPGDHVSDQGGLKVVVPAGSIEQLRGATLDLPRNPGQGGLVIRNPNRPNPLLGATLELTGDLAEKVQQLLAESINPSLAMHGGYASLVGVEDTKVFLTMGGGCQGCALSAATLREGIQVAIREAIPEVTEVIDVTDHESGENPFYR
ncbi:NifU family protein [Rhabdothermincola sp.]|uniref:NifU family protein n=1 Tax=Rhabdothermincola sp. TaxID=2820405 RepID=UPI002FE037EE